jgi:hypothetical protein
VEAKLTDLPDQILGNLAELGTEATLALYDLTLGVRGWGPGERFAFLDGPAKLEALDAFLFLADQTRFELMRRLGWAEQTAGEHYALIDLAVDFGRIKKEFKPAVPELRPDFPRFKEFELQLQTEPEMVLRSLIPQALEAFQQRLRKGK